jgi:hypothetical protein
MVIAPPTRLRICSTTIMSFVLISCVLFFFLYYIDSVVLLGIRIYGHMRNQSGSKFE